ncbi:MAG TPA: hypothetical protein VKH81_04190 [Candidatus Angelobacter sp.]|nr:hypothetical protein [Candidatus Angelobacter sp.]
MLVQVLSFGTNWWARFGKDPDDPHRFTRHAAYYNSTGVKCGGKVRRHWVTSGLIRFNGVGDFNPHHPQRAIGRTFACADLTQAYGGNRLLFGRKAVTSAIPDCYLIAVSSQLHGQIDFTSAAWKSIFSEVIAASRLREEQEAMLLMRPGDWVQTSSGFWQLIAPTNARQPGKLVRIGERISA